MKALTASLLIALAAMFLVSRLAQGQENEATDAQSPPADADTAAKAQGVDESEAPDDAPPKTENPPTAEQTATQAGEKAAAWEKSLADWKDLLSELRQLRERYITAENAELPKIRKQYDDLRAQGTKQLADLKQIAREAYVEAPNENRELLRFLLQVAVDGIRRDQYQDALEAAEFLIDNHCEDKQVYNIAGIAAYGSDQFEVAKKYLALAAEAGTLTDDGEGAYKSIDDVMAKWEEELAFRAAEAKADDLPRVRIKTSQGDIVAELFENEAPDTVGNFISLVEKGFYDNREFFRVIQGFMAQVGSPTDDGTGGPGYQIYCECYEEPHRNHFAGSLSMAHAGRDTGGSQFYITFKPTPHLNGRHTVFGRVIEGMDVLSKIQRFNPGEHKGGPKPQFDKIEEIMIERKRDHEYKPNKVK